MLVAGGLFAGGTASFSWSRVPIWKTMQPGQFAADFSATLRFTDKVQPALLVITILSAAAFAVAADGWSRVFAWAGATGFAVVLAASVAVLVPLQRRIIAAGADQPLDAMRHRWFRGHLGRSGLSTASFVSIALAAAL